MVSRVRIGTTRTKVQSAKVTFMENITATMMIMVKPC